VELETGLTARPLGRLEAVARAQHRRHWWPHRLAASPLHRG